MKKYTILYKAQRSWDEITFVLSGDVKDRIVGKSDEVIVVEAEDGLHARRVASAELQKRRAEVVPHWKVIDRILEATREVGVEDEEVVYWLVSPSTYWEEQDEPFNHLDDPDGMVLAVKYALDPDWIGGA